MLRSLTGKGILAPYIGSGYASLWGGASAVAGAIWVFLSFAFLFMTRSIHVYPYDCYGNILSPREHAAKTVPQHGSKCGSWPVMFASEVVRYHRRLS